MSLVLDAPTKHSRLLAWVADMVELPSFGEFDLVWALDDAVNYLLSLDELKGAMAGMAGNLAPNGLLAFDLNTLHTYRTFFAGDRVVESGDGRRLVWKGQAAADVPPGSICEARFAVETERERGSIAAATHRQRHFPQEEVLAALDLAGLEAVAVFGYGFDAVLQQPLDDLRHSKALFIARPAQTRCEGGEP